MNTSTAHSIRSIFVALSAGVLMSIGSSVFAGGMILDEAIDDYSGEAPTGVAASHNTSGRGYQATFILEEAYNDYDSVSPQDLEQVEFAVFEPTLPQIPWELNVTD